MSCLSALALSAVLAPSAGDIECHVARVGGVPTFVVDGVPHSGVCYSTYDVSDPAFQRRVKQFAEAGCRIVNFVVEISGYGYSPPMWVARDRWDFAELDRRAEAVLSAAPDALLLPRIYVDAPLWWCDEHPDELMVLGNGDTGFGERLFALPRAGPFASLASRRWRDDMDRALERVIDHIQATPWGGRVIGYQLSGQKTEEWYHWSMSTPLLGDYSQPMVEAFRAWLRDRYRTDAALRDAWRDPAATLAAAEIPSQEQRFGDVTRTFRDPECEQPVIDFHRFWSDIMADTIAHFAGVVKRKAGGRKVVGAFYAYTFEFTDLAEDAGHLAVGRLIRCPEIDFIMAPSSYYNRNLPGAPYFRAPVASLAHHGKVFWNDFDQVSFRYYDKLKADPNLKQWEYQMGLTQTPEEFVWMNAREVGLELTQGVQLAHFDIHGGYYEDPKIMHGVARVARIRDRDLRHERRGSTAQILVVADEDSEHYLAFRSPITTTLLSHQVAVLPFVAPYDTALLSDLAELDLGRYRLVLVLNACAMPSEARGRTRRLLADRGRTVVWFHAPGLIDETGADIDHIRELTGIGVVRDGKVDDGSAAFVEADMPAAPVIRGDSFRVDDAEAQALAVCDGLSSTVLVARKRVGNSTSVYSAVAPLPAEFLRRLAADAGVHLYTEDARWLVSANEGYMVLGAPAEGGPCVLSLPRPRDVVDAMSGLRIARSADRIELGFRPKEVRLLELR